MDAERVVYPGLDGAKSFTSRSRFHAFRLSPLCHNEQSALPTHVYVHLMCGAFSRAPSRLARTRKASFSATFFFSASRCEWTSLDNKGREQCERVLSRVVPICFARLFLSVILTAGQRHLHVEGASLSRIFSGGCTDTFSLPTTLCLSRLFSFILLFFSLSLSLPLLQEDCLGWP